MIWFALAIGVLLGLVAVFHFSNRWVRPWREIDQLVKDVVAGNRPRTFLIGGNPIARRVGLALEDVFRLKNEVAERASQCELNLDTILSAMPDGLAVIDAEKQVRLVNAAARRMFSIAETGQGGTPLEFFRDNVIAQRIEETLLGGHESIAAVKLHENARQIVVTVLPISERGGAVALFRDVTQLQQLEQVRRDFVSNVSHELRTPLSIFRGYLETLLDEPDLDRKERERILRVMEKHSERLNSLAEDLLSLARLEAPDAELNFTAIDLRDFLDRISREWEKRAAAKQLAITTQLAPDLPMMQADEVRLEEVIYNLLDNAIKYSNTGGRITIGAARENGGLAITVSDEGSGVPLADLPRIFERFYRADKARSGEVSGTGLGLSIVKHIAELHGGSVGAESQLGRGTTIHVTLPVSNAQPTRQTNFTF